MIPVGGLPLDSGDTTSLVFNGPRCLTRGDIRDRSDVLAAALVENKIRRAMVCSDDPADILRAVDACSRAGCDLWIAHTNLTAAHIEGIVAASGIQYLIGRQDEMRASAPGSENTGDARIHLMTSGTTGLPKIAAHTLDSLFSRIQGQVRLPANRDGRWLLTYQPTAFAGMQVILTAVLSGGAIVVPEERSIAGYYQAASAHKVTHISATPTFWRSFLMVAQPGTPPLRQITLGGEGADQATLDRVQGAFPDARVTHVYASTESGVIFAVHDGKAGFPSQWLEQPVQGVCVRIRDGMLQVKTPHAMQGYVGGVAQPLTNDGWVATADRAEVRGDRVFILGREDAVINVGGSKVYPQELEAFLLGIDGVREARVWGVRNPISGFLVAGEVVLANGESPADARMRILDRCRGALPSYKLPRVLNIVDSIQVLPSGKKS